MVTLALNALTDLKMLQRSVSAEGPVRTLYKLSKKGRSVAQNLKGIEREVA
ncbi:MAG: winged helix-turn-helix transcriptional regulator [Nitrososphaerales archaeon]